MILFMLILCQIVSTVDPYGQIIIRISPIDGDQTVFSYDMSQIQGQHLNADISIQAQFYQKLHSVIKQSESFIVYSEDRISDIVSCNVLNESRPTFCQGSTVMVLNSVNNASAYNIDFPKFTQHVKILVQIKPKQFGVHPINKTIEFNFGENQEEKAYINTLSQIISDRQAGKYKYSVKNNGNVYNYYMDPDSQIVFQLQYQQLYQYFLDHEWIINNNGYYFSYNNYKSEHIPSFCNKLPTNVSAWKDNLEKYSFYLTEIPLNKYVAISDQGYCYSDDGGINSLSKIQNSKDNSICDQLGCQMENIKVQDNEFIITNIKKQMELMMIFPVKLVTFQNIYQNDKIKINASIIQTSPQRINISVLSNEVQIIGQYRIYCGDDKFIILSDFYGFNEQKNFIFNFTHKVNDDLICQLEKNVLELNKTEMTMQHNETFKSADCGLHVRIKENLCLTFCANDTIYDKVAQYCIPKKCPQAFPIFDPQTLTCITNDAAQKTQLYKSPFELLNLLIKPTELDCGRGTSDPVTGLCSCPPGFHSFVQEQNTVKMCQQDKIINKSICPEYPISKIFTMFLGDFNQLSIFKLIGSVVGVSAGIFGIIALVFILIIVKTGCGCIASLIKCLTLCCKNKSNKKNQMLS